MLRVVAKQHADAGNAWQAASIAAAVDALASQAPAIDLSSIDPEWIKYAALMLRQDSDATDERCAAELDRLLALIDGQGSSCALPAASAKALHEAVAAIYFSDSSDYLSALWQVVRILDPSVAHLLERDESAAYDQTASALQPTKAEGESA